MSTDNTRRDPWARHTDPDVWDHVRAPGTALRGRRLREGDLVAWRYGAWKVIEVRPTADIDLTDGEREQLAKHRPEEREQHRPQQVYLQHEAGPLLAPDGWRVKRYPLGQRVLSVTDWGNPWKVLGERWPQCSCHGHPWPCLDTDRDRVAAMQAKVLGDHLAKAVPGVCPHCGEPVTNRQKALAYPGDNADVPGGPEPTFHLRRGCYGGAQEYELRWLAQDPRRERILTWPKCGGILVVHADGSSECTPWTKPGVGDVQAPGCRGHSTHDHGTATSCPAHPRLPGGGCPRGCDPAEHSGCQPSDRALRPLPGALL